jgi:hypothetical protein
MEKTSIRQRLRNPAFRNGLLDGFGAPALFFRKSDNARSGRINADIASAWYSVQSVLNESFFRVSSECAEASGKKAKARLAKN